MNVFISISLSHAALTIVLVLIEMVLLSIHNICSGRDLNLCFGCSKNHLINKVLRKLSTQFS